MLRTEINETDEIFIKDNKFQGLINEDLKKIISALVDNEYAVRIVGGAVRDILLGLKPRDIDLLTTAKPDEIIYLASELDLDADAWGIRHGTIKILIGKEKYEITSLNFQIHKQDGKIVVLSHGTWEDDASRRDFTVNALSMTLDGKVYDYLGGLKDLKHQIIRPLGDFESKVKEDPILIIRFFKMVSKFNKPKFSKSTLDVVVDNKDLIKSIEVSRLRKELQNIKKGPNAEAALALLKRTGIAEIIETITKR